MPVQIIESDRRKSVKFSQGVFTLIENTLSKIYEVNYKQKFYNHGVIVRIQPCVITS